MPQSREDYHRSRRWLGLLPGDDVIVHLKKDCRHCHGSHQNLRYKRIEAPYPIEKIGGYLYECNFRAKCPVTGQDLFGAFPYEAYEEIPFGGLLMLATMAAEDPKEVIPVQVSGPRYTLLGDLRDVVLTLTLGPLVGLAVLPMALMIQASNRYYERGESIASALGAAVTVSLFGAAVPIWSLSIIAGIGLILYGIVTGASTLFFWDVTTAFRGPSITPKPN